MKTKSMLIALLLLVQLGCQSHPTQTIVKPQATGPLPASDPTNTGNWVLNSYNSDEFNTGTLNSKWATMSSTGNTAAVGIDPVTGEQSLILTVTYAGATSGTGNSPSWQKGVGVVLGPSFNTQGSNGTWAGYGYYEARIKSNAASASSTFWLYGGSGDGSAWSTEIDIEDGGGHYTNPPASGSPTIADFATQEGGVWAYPGNPKLSTGKTYSNTGVVNPKVANMSTAYHTYGLQWDANYITWYIDGVKTYQVKNNSTSAVGVTPPGNTFNNPMQVILDSSIFTGWYGNPIASQMPAVTYYDYVRVWTAGPTKQNPVLTPITGVNVPVGTTLTGLATASVPGTFAYTPATATAVGTLSVTATFTPTDTAGYNGASIVVPITVAAAVPATPVITPFTATYVTYRATDPTTGAMVPGSFSYTNVTGGISVLFTPTNTTAYSSVTIVVKAK